MKFTGGSRRGAAKRPRRHASTPVWSIVLHDRRQQILACQCAYNREGKDQEWQKVNTKVNKHSDTSNETRGSSDVFRMVPGLVNAVGQLQAQCRGTVQLLEEVAIDYRQTRRESTGV